MGAPGVPLRSCTSVVPQFPPASPYVFPDPRQAGPEGLVAMGGDFEPGTIMQAYASGVFPWPHPGEEYLWFSPDPRCLFEIDGLHVSRRLARTIRSGRFTATVDADFPSVIAACADREDGTWITPNLIAAYTRLHELGWAHSVEVWTADGTLAGGLYGIGLGAMFGAESMFFRVRDASKVALVALMQHARRLGLHFIDIQVATAHTLALGAVEVSREEYLGRLDRALRVPVDWTSLGVLGDSPRGCPRL